MESTIIPISIAIIIDSIIVEMVIGLIIIFTTNSTEYQLIPQSNF